MSSDVLTSPRRTVGAVIHRPSGAEARWIVETPDGRTVRLGAQVGRLYECLDGSSSADMLAERMGEPWTTDAVNSGIARLRESGLLAEAGIVDRRRPGRFQAPSMASLQLTLLDHPALFSGQRSWTKVAASTWSTAAALALGTVGLAVLLGNARQIQADLSSPVAPLTTLALVMLMVFLTSLHELGHAVALARYGGSVRRIGVMLFYLSPAMFCDVSDAWRLPDKRQRVVVALAGGVVSFALAGACAVLYAVSPLGGPLLAAVAVASYAAVVFNLLPFVKFDGYIALMTHLDVPNLRSIAMEEWKRALLIVASSGIRAYRPSIGRWLPWYGLGCSLMPIMLLGSVAIQLDSVVAGLGVVGVLLRSAIWVSIGVVILRGAWRIRELSFELGTSRWTYRALTVTATALILALSLISIPSYLGTGYATVADGTRVLIVPSGWRAEDLTDRTVTLFQAGLLGRVKVGAGVSGSRGEYVSLPVSTPAPALGYEGAVQSVHAIPLDHSGAPESLEAVGLAQIHLGTTPAIVWAWRTIVGEPVRALF